MFVENLLSCTLYVSVTITIVSGGFPVSGKWEVRGKINKNHAIWIGVLLPLVHKDGIFRGKFKIVYSREKEMKIHLVWKQVLSVLLYNTLLLIRAHLLIISNWTLLFYNESVTFEIELHAVPGLLTGVVIILSKNV